MRGDSPRHGVDARFPVFWSITKSSSLHTLLAATSIACEKLAEACDSSESSSGVAAQRAPTTTAAAEQAAHTQRVERILAAPFDRLLQHDLGAAPSGRPSRAHAYMTAALSLRFKMCSAEATKASGDTSDFARGPPKRFRDEARQGKALQQSKEMSATTFKNAVRRREHYERSQPAARTKYGLLEKHTDYVARAQNFHAKEKRIAALRAKAENRNKDEFYFAMTKASTKRGVHSLGRGDKNGLTVDRLQELKAQDLAYLRTKKSAEDKKIERLQASLQAIAATAPRSHVVFRDEDDEESAGAGGDGAAADDGDGSAAAAASALLLGRSGGAAGAGSGTAPVDSASRKRRRQLESQQERSYAELDARLDRSEQMGALAARIELQTHLLKKGRRVKLSAPDPATGEAAVTVFKWKPQRAK